MEVTLDPASGLDPVTRLLGVSQQIRREVYNLIATVATFHLKVGVFKNLTLKPYSTALNISMRNDEIARGQALISRIGSRYARKAFRERIIQQIEEDIKVDKEVPHDFKFWKLCISVLNTQGRTRLVADIDFRKKEFCVSSTHWRDFRDWEHARSLKKTFNYEIQEFTKEEEFNGLTVQDVSRFLEQIDMPNPYGFWRQGEMFDGLKEIPGDNVDDETDDDLTERDLPFRRRFDRVGSGFGRARHGFGRLRAERDLWGPPDEDEPDNLDPESNEEESEI